MILLRATTWTLSIWSHMDQAYHNGAKPSMKLYISVFIYLPGILMQVHQSRNVDKRINHMQFISGDPYRLFREIS